MYHKKQNPSDHSESAPARFKFARIGNRKMQRVRENMLSEFE